MNNSNKGWIKLHRTILENPTLKGRRLALWVTLLLLASHDPCEAVFDGKRITLLPGQFITGRLYLANNSSYSEGGVEKVLLVMEKEQQIEQQKSNKNRLITIKAWEKYQQKEQQSDNRVTTKEQQSDTYKKDKKIKNVRKKENKEAFSKPCVEDVKLYQLERGSKVDAEEFWNFYESKGWKVGTAPMKSWQSAWITWEKRYRREHPNEAPQGETKRQLYERKLGIKIHPEAII